nr:type I polyketide synthase 9 [Streptomyces sp.]
MRVTGMNDADLTQTPDGQQDGHLAVVGLACRFPGADDADAFWRNLADGRDTITRYPKRPTPRDGTGGSVKEYVPARGLLTDPEWFDAGYFGCSADQARAIDPQHRVLLECAVQALENAGQDPERFPGPIGIYAGGTETAYADILRSQRAELAPLTEDDILLGTAPDFLAARAAHALGLRGPAVTVQNACATALVAVHMAAQSLLLGECDLALAGGVAVHVPAKDTTYSADGILSADGYCRAFDASGQGTIGSNGVGIVVLKRLSEALRDGDHIRAVLRGSSVTNDGPHRVGFTAPSVDGQAAAIREAQLVAGVHASTLTYIEAHATATPLGDPIELAALTKAFRNDTDRRDFCRIGSVKTNIGHTDAAAGAAGLIKTILALEHGLIPPSLHFSEPNPQCDLDAGPFRVATRLEEWRAGGSPRRAGVSSFGIGGANAHVIVEEAPGTPPPAPAPPWHLMVLSARTPTALDAATAQLSDHLRARPALSAADVAWTLQVGRRRHEYRRYALVSGREDAVEVLCAKGHQRLVTSTGAPRECDTAFLFPGTGTGPEGAAVVRRLYEGLPAFRRAIDACCLAAPAQQASAVREAVSRGEQPSADPSVADLTAFAQEYALARLWMFWGVGPAALLGTGTGALAAAAVAGTFKVADAVRLVLERAALRQRSDAAPAAGAADAGRFERLVREIGPAAPRLPLVSALTGDRLTPEEAADAAYWARSLSGETRTEDALSTLLTHPGRALLELGAGRTLTTAARRRPQYTEAHLLLPAAPGAEDDGAGEADGPPRMLAVLGELWLAGLPVAWERVHGGGRPVRVPLPTYPFERQRHIVEPRQAPPSTAGGAAPPAVVDDLTADAAGPAAAAGRADAGDDPQQETLPVVARLFAEALGLPEVDPEESFFDLGGDSLLAARLLTRIRVIFPVDIKVKTMFTAPSAVELADLLDELTADADSLQRTS